LLYHSHLEIFIKTADAGSFSKAAESMFITPSAVIKQINLLEENVDMPLFIRTHRGLTLTEAGKSLYKDAGKIMKLCNEAEERARKVMQKENAVIRIGSSPMTPAEVLVELWPMIYKENPELKFQLIPYENTPENAREILKNLGRDIDIVAGIFDDQLLHYRECSGIELSQEPLSIAVPIFHSLAGKDKLTIEDLYDQKLLLLKPGSMNAVDRLRSKLANQHPQIEIIDFDFYNTEVFNLCEKEGYLLMAVPKWKSVHPLLKITPVEWEYMIPYGLLYSRNPDAKVCELLRILRK